MNKAFFSNGGEGKEAGHSFSLCWDVVWWIEKGKPVARQGRKAIGPFGNEWQPGRQLIWKEHN